MSEIIRDLKTALEAVRDGTKLAVPPDYSGVAMAATHALIGRGVKRLHLVALPTSGLQADLLIGAGCVETVEAAAVGFGELGLAPRFTAALKAGSIRILDATCPAIHAAMQAAEKGIPFMPLRGIIGSDILARRPDWKVIDNPFADHSDPIVLLPAIRPDVALFHAPMADREGNVWVGRRRELFTLAHAAARTIVTVERIYDGRLLDDEQLAAATITSLYIDAVAVAARGAWPLRLGAEYGDDTTHLAEYLRQAATEEGFRRYLDHQASNRRAA